jgi:competence protein ComEC
MGDAGVEVEEDLIKKYNLQNIDILKVGHHGSKTSSGKAFIDEINPNIRLLVLVKITGMVIQMMVC